MSAIDGASTRSIFLPGKNTRATGKAGQAGLKRNTETRKNELEAFSKTDSRVEIPEAIKDFSRIKKVADAAPDMDNRMESKKDIQHNDRMAVFYFEVTDLWKRLCEEHVNLFNLTCDEYSLLLSSQLEELEEKLVEKNVTIKKIHHLELVRQNLIADLNDFLPDQNIDSVSTLLKVMNLYHVEMKEKHLFRFNALLIDMIEKIQAQNKRNQLFINKALHSLKQIRQDVLGKKSYSTYSARGSTVSTST
jgi:flagellar biosynthesis/type III secretory pathway chaperone